MSRPRSVSEISAAVCSGRSTAGQVVADALAAASRLNPSLNAFLSTFTESAMRAAMDVDARVARGERPPLAGVPIALKDNICVGPDLNVPGDAVGYGGFTTCASKMLEKFASPYTATAAQRLIHAGAVIIGKTNLDEFAMGSSTENSAFGPTRNPWDLSRVPGGSSGGSAAAVAAGIVPAALGSDTGGSIRQPAGLCGVVGVKPTYGRVSRYGLVAFASSLDQIGPLTHNVTDAALVLEAICGHDEHDATSADKHVPRWSQLAEMPIERLTLGVPRQARSDSNHPEVARVFEEAISTFTSLGARIVDVEMPLIDHGIAAYYIVAPAEASSNLARFDGLRYGRSDRAAPGDDLFDVYCRNRSQGFGPEVKRRVMLGTHVLSSGYYDAYYTTALKVRRRILAEFSAAFVDLGCHCVLMPASPSPAFGIGEKGGDPLAMYLEDVYTVGVNLAGLPGMTIPAGFANSPKLPVGIQLVAPAFDEETMLRAARMFERASPGATARPPLTA
ncbi:MAG: Asp-tRNA(Asn)/Glu-tRNA(Gln) amidotransferase subunit GatA [Planctomycetes bacterium]|nr:Asp-tRNA(Asn)/Glu-tRNA(Gln) amidotransferase subunit GatA [Planctomycetota bacterium]